MNEPAKTFASALKKLSEVVDLEAEALRDRAFGKLTAVLEQKDSAVKQLEAMERTLTSVDDLDALSTELAALQIKAKANAERLKKMAQGVQHARSRLATLLESDRQFGAYGKDGAPMRVTSTSTLKSQA